MLWFVEEVLKRFQMSRATQVMCLIAGVHIYSNLIIGTLLFARPTYLCLGHIPAKVFVYYWFADMMLLLELTRFHTKLS